MFWKNEKSKTVNIGVITVDTEKKKKVLNGISFFMRWIFSNPPSKKKIRAKRAENSYPNVPMSGVRMKITEKIKTRITEREKKV